MPRKSTPALLALIVAAALLAGCAASGSRSAKANKAYPAWVLNPDYPGHIGVVGSAPRQDMGGLDAQYRVATLKARQELAQMIRVHVESTSRTKIEDRRGSATRELDMETRLRSIESLSLDRARVINEWVDPESGDLYLFLVTPKYQSGRGAALPAGRTSPLPTLGSEGRPRAFGENPLQPASRRYSSPPAPHPRITGIIPLL